MGQPSPTTGSGRKIIQEAWRWNQRNGPYKMWNADGQLLVSGQFREGKSHGTWSVWNAKGRLLREEVYRDGKPLRHVDRIHNGGRFSGRKRRETLYANERRVEEVYYRRTTDGLVVSRVAFKKGRPVRVDGEAIVEFTQRLAGAPAWVQATLDRQSQLEFKDATLDDIIAQLREQELFELPIGLCTRAISERCDLDQRITRINSIPCRCD